MDKTERLSSGCLSMNVPTVSETITSLPTMYEKIKHRPRSDDAAFFRVKSMFFRKDQSH